jgi:hypothetical protein
MPHGTTSVLHRRGRHISPISAVFVGSSSQENERISEIWHPLFDLYFDNTFEGGICNATYTANRNCSKKCLPTNQFIQWVVDWKASRIHEPVTVFFNGILYFPFVEHSCLPTLPLATDISMHNRSLRMLTIGRNWPPTN